MPEMMKWLPVCALAAALVGCKGEVKIQDSPQTLKALEDCQQGRTDKDKYVKELEARLFDLEQKGGADSEVVVTITGDTLTISGQGPGGGGGGGGGAPDQELFESFVKQVQQARGSMQRCYQNALKKDTGLQARTMTMNVQVRFTPAGKVSQASFSPRISDSFDSCMSTVARRWKLDGTSGPIVFKQPITLTPQ
jgi:hypothetical protein